MICLFDNKATKNDLLETNGEYVLDLICKSAIVTEELNGEYSLDCVIAINKDIDSRLYELITEDSLLKVDEEYGKEYFRIAKVSKNNKYITVFARHITIADILTMFCEDVRPENQSGNGAINWIFDNALGKKWFNVTSNISVNNTAYYINKNVYEALFTVDNSFLKRWGGEVYRRGFEIKINDKVGEDRGVSIRSKKNLLGFEANTNNNKLATRIYPKGFDGITIEEKHIDSPLINNYSAIYSKEVKFDDIRVNDESFNEGYATLKDAQEEMKRRVNEMFEIEKVDVITAEYRVDFIELAKTEEYKDYSILEKTWLGDTIEAIEDTLKINVSVRVVKRKFDIKKKRRIETELSNKDLKIKPPTINDIIHALDKIPENMEDVLSEAKKHATSLINAGINGYVVVNKNEILIMDTPDKNTATKVWRFNVNGLGYSGTGYYGEYGLAMTMDGQIVADFITTGILNANLIKAGIIKSLDSSTWINMETGEFNFKDKIKYINNNFSVLDGNFILENGVLTLLKGSIKIKNELGEEVFKTDSKGDVIFNGYLQGKDQQLKLIGDSMKIDGRNGALRFQYDPENYLYIHPTKGIRYYNSKVYEMNITAPAFETDIQGHFNIYTGGGRLKILKSGGQIQSRMADDSGYASVAASDFYPQSKKEFKDNIQNVDNIDFLDIINRINVKQYNLKTDIEEIANTPIVLPAEGAESVKPDTKLGIIVEEIPEDLKQYIVPNNSDGISLYNMMSVLLGALKTQQKEIETLKTRLK